MIDLKPEDFFGLFLFEVKNSAGFCAKIIFQT